MQKLKKLNSDIFKLSKKQRNQIKSSSKFAGLNGRFTNLHSDIVESLPEGNGNSYLLIIIDRLIRWPGVVPLKNITR